jgi:uncharacterized protein
LRAASDKNAAGEGVVRDDTILAPAGEIGQATGAMARGLFFWYYRSTINPKVEDTIYHYYHFQSNKNMENKILEGHAYFLKPATGLLFLVLTVYVGALAVNTIKESKYVGHPGASINTINVSGTGEVYASPDLATMDFSVVSEAKAVNQAMDDNTRKMNVVIAAIKGLGVAETDLRTSGFDINPHYDYVNEPVTAACAGGLCPVSMGGKRVLSGYDITQTLTVKVRQENMSKIGQMIQDATGAGANEVGDLQFTIDKPDDLQAEARKQAIDKAKAKAKILAEQLGVKLGNITGYSEGGYYPTYTMVYDAKASGAVASEAAVSPAIQTGQNKIESNVNITYEIE